MSRMTATVTTSDLAMTGCYGAIGIVAVTAALMFSSRTARANLKKTERVDSLPVFAPIADYLRH